MIVMMAMVGRSGCRASQTTDFYPEGNNAHGHQGQKRDPTPEDGAMELGIQEYWQDLVMPKQDHDDAERSARADCPELLHVVGRAVTMVMIVTHQISPSLPAFPRYREPAS
jgi:hypothetical protein